MFTFFLTLKLKNDVQACDDNTLPVLLYQKLLPINNIIVNIILTPNYDNKSLLRKYTLSDVVNIYFLWESFMILKFPMVPERLSDTPFNCENI